MITELIPTPARLREDIETTIVKRIVNELSEKGGYTHTFGNRDGFPREFIVPMIEKIMIAFREKGYTVYYYPYSTNNNSDYVRITIEL